MKYLPYRLIRYLEHQWRGKAAFRIHSPHVFAFQQQVWKGGRSEVGGKIESFRKKLTQNSQRLERLDLGAGSMERGTSYPTTIAQLAKMASRRRREGELLRRICAHYQPKRCLELGTHLGISALYQLSGLNQAEFISLEGDPTLAQLANQHLAEFGYEAEVQVGDFADLLSQLNLAEWRPDYVLIDGNHRYEPTLAYFQTLLPHLADGGMLIFDDIHWSPEMSRAWAEICAHPEVSVSLDGYFLGICFVRRPQAKEHFVLW
ncbi:MAG: class I SAM-dependent methyltransferase [Bacteroidota bacterium]